MAYNWKTSSQFWIQMLDLNDVVVFARVVEAGSFTAAARLLGMPKIGETNIQAANKFFDVNSLIGRSGNRFYMNSALPLFPVYNYMFVENFPPLFMGTQAVALSTTRGRCLLRLYVNSFASWGSRLLKSSLVGMAMSIGVRSGPPIGIQ